jgi:acetylornithine deacetylase/succinyl-diaminopimelate desuccinylase-like protein
VSRARPGRRAAIVAAAALLLAGPAGRADAQAPARTPSAAPRALAQQVDAGRTANEPAVLREFAELLAIPNIASDSVNIRRNARWIVDAYAKRGVALRLLESPSGGPPAVFGELRAPGATRTVLLYAHYDGQPVNPAEWATPPFTPTLRDGPLESGGKVVPLPDRPGVTGDEWRLFGRGAGDDKAPILAVLAALDAMKAGGAKPSVNVKFYFDGEEEAGDPHLRPLLEQHRELLRADVLLFADGPVHQTRRQQIVYGVRGTMGMELTTYGPLRALHSGHYGNWAPNPIASLAGLLAKMRDDEGRILIPGFLDDVRAATDADRRAIAAAPSADSALRHDLALGRTEGGETLGESIMRPALNLRGIRSGGVGPAGSNTIQPEATASIDFRLVPDQTPARIREKIEGFLTAQGWHVVHDVPTPEVRRAHPRVVRVDWREAGYAAVRSPLDLPAARAIVRVVGDAHAQPPVEVPILGGSLPIADFVDVLKTPVLIVPIANHDDAQHAPNEHLRLRNLWDGIVTFGAIFTRLGAEWPGAAI